MRTAEYHWNDFIDFFYFKNSHVWINPRSLVCPVSSSWPSRHDILLMGWALSSSRCWLATPTHSAPSLPQNISQAAQIVGGGLCDWVGVQLSLSVLCRVLSHTKEIAM